MSSGRAERFAQEMQRAADITEAIEIREQARTDALVSIAESLATIAKLLDGAPRQWKP